MSELNNDPFLAATTNVNPPEKPIPIGSIVKEGEADIHENTSPDGRYIKVPKNVILEIKYLSNDIKGSVR